MYRVLMLLSLLGLVACNTINGIGQDISKGGEKVQQAATSVQKNL